MTTHAEKLERASVELQAFLAGEAENPTAGLELPRALCTRSELAYSAVVATYSILRAMATAFGVDPLDFPAFVHTHRDHVARGILDVMKNAMTQPQRNDDDPIESQGQPA